MNTAIEQEQEIAQEPIEAETPTVETEPEPTNEPEKEPSEPADAVDTAEQAAVTIAETAEEPSSESEQISAELAALKSDLEETKRLLDQAKRERDVQRVLMEAGAVDLEAGTLLLTAALGTEGAEPQDEAGRKRRMEKAVRELVRSKPAMFRPLPGSAYAVSRGRGAAGATNIARFDEESNDVSLRQAARAAAIAGDRRSLMDYLRLRRVPA